MPNSLVPSPILSPDVILSLDDDHPSIAFIKYFNSGSLNNVSHDINVSNMSNSVTTRTPRKAMSRCTSRSSICMGPGAGLFYVNSVDVDLDDYEEIILQDDDGATHPIHTEKSFKERILAYCTGKHFLGIFLIVLVAFIWVGASVWIQRLFGEYDYNKPYFLTYFNTTGFCFWNFGFLFCKSWRQVPITDNIDNINDELCENDAGICTYRRGNNNNWLRVPPQMPFTDSFPTSTNVGVAVCGDVVSPTTADSADIDYAGHREAHATTVGKETNSQNDVEHSNSIPVIAVSIPSPITRPIGILKHEPLIDDTYLAHSLQPGDISDSSSKEVTGVSQGSTSVREPEEVADSASCRCALISKEKVNEDNANPYERQHINCPTDGVSNNDQSDVEIQIDKQYSLLRVAKGVLFFCPLWFLANVLFNYSLSDTSVASNTIISATSSIWTMALSKLLLNQNICLVHKIIAVMFSITGTCLVALNDNVRYSDDDETHTNIVLNSKTMTGDILALFSAVFYACYTTVLKWKLPDDDCFKIGMVFGLVGVLNLVLMWPGLILMHFTGIEKFELPSPFIFAILAANSLIGTNLSDVMWAKSVLLTSPLVATLGLSLTIPIAMVADSLLKGKEFSPLYIIGAILVTLGFVIVNLRQG